MRWVTFLWRLPALALIGFVRLYQMFLSPIFGRQCRFQPTCSNYFIQAVRKYGAVSGAPPGVVGEFERVIDAQHFVDRGQYIPGLQRPLDGILRLGIGRPECWIRSRSASDSRAAPRNPALSAVRQVMPWQFVAAGPCVSC